MEQKYSVSNTQITNYVNIEKYHTGIKLDETMLALLFEGLLVKSDDEKGPTVATSTAAAETV